MRMQSTLGRCCSQAFKTLMYILHVSGYLYRQHVAMSLEWWIASGSLSQNGPDSGLWTITIYSDIQCNICQHVGLSQHAMVQMGFLTAVRTGRFAVASERNVARKFCRFCRRIINKPQKATYGTDHGDEHNPSWPSSKMCINGMIPAVWHGWMSSVIISDSCLKPQHARGMSQAGHKHMSRMKRAGVVEPEVILKQFDMFSASPESINDPTWVRSTIP